MPTHTKNRWWMYLGHVFVGLGLIGVVVRGLPTTFMLICALWCYKRGSPYHYEKLLNHPRFGIHLRNWEEHKAIPLKAKIIALVMIAASFSFLVLYVFSDYRLMVKILVGMIGFFVFSYVGTRTTLTEHTRNTDLL